jgi:hypothetical protein
VFLKQKVVKKFKKIKPAFCWVLFDVSYKSHEGIREGAEARDS